MDIQVTKVMKVALADALREFPEKAPDASALALLVVAKPNQSVPELVQAVRINRDLAAKVLKAAGYCSCGTRIIERRCPLCSTLHEVDKS